ncbi:cyclic di-3',5'-guanylate-activated glycosyltransferase NrfB [Escherichia coli]
MELKKLMEHISIIPDYRQAWKVEHKLSDILLLTICAVISGAESWEDIEDFGETHLDFLKQYGDFENGIPVHDTIARVVSCISPAKFHECFINWMRDCHSSNDKDVIAIDGKTLRHSYDKSRRRGAIHVISAFSTMHSLVIGQIKTDEKSNEITAIPELLNMLDMLAVIMFISGLDDFFIDVVYWVRRIKRKLSVYRRYPRMSYRELYKPDEKPLAIMVPAWNETGVIGNMAELAATTLDYENYHIFVGTYPNDPDTQRDVDEVCARFPNVHKVVCARPGPTSKADCLNNVLDAITQFERSANFAFAGFILHDAEDVISPMELRLFNYLVERKDLIQIPVYPFEREWTHFTSMTYIDEFSELHGKDVPVREALAGQVPSAGVGTCFSRRAVTALLADGDGIAFDVQSLTEDYDIGFRLKEKGMTEIFVRFPVVDEAKEREQRKFLQHARTSNMICVREYFPDTFSTAVRQKSRWIIGIVFQGFKTHKWTSSLTLNYFLWRDRKGAISNFVSFLAMLVMLQLLLLLAYESLWPDAWHFLSIFSGSAWLMTLLWLNFGLMFNRIVQRVIFVTGYYGLTQGLLSVLRLFWGNLINFMANWRALKQVLQHGDPRRVAWDKTTHDFPSVTGDTRSLRSLGQILLENQVITEEQLDTALRNRVEGLRLGGSMLMQGLISAEQLAQALAEQNGVAWESIDAWQIPSSLIAEMPASVALHYAVLPLRLENDELIVGSEDGIDPVSLAALTRKVGRKVRYVIVLRGQIVTGLRHWYARRRGHDPRAMLYNAVQHQWLTEQQTGEIWRQYVPHQFLFAEILTTLGHINRSAINVLLLRHERSSLPLGKFLVTEGVISQETLDRVLTIQRELQVSMQSLLLKAGLNTEQVAQLESENEGE